jgi:replicative DNA helicase
MQLQIEREMLSSMMNAGDELFELARTKIRPEYFSIEHHGLIFEALIAAYDATGGKDRSSTVIMSQAGKIQRAPGVAMLDEFDDLDIDIDYLDGIRKMMVSAEAGKEHVSYIHEQADRKRLKDAATEIYSVADGNDPDYREKSEKLFGEAVMGDSDESVYSGTQLAAMVWNGLTGAQPIKSSNSLTGIFEVDDYFLGFTAGAYYLIAAPTHNGKTIVGKNLIVQAAYNSDIVFVYFPFEENELLAEISFWSLMTGPDIKWIIEKEEPKNRIPMHKKRISEIIAYRYDPESVLRRYASKKAAGKEDSTFAYGDARVRECLRNHVEGDTVCRAESEQCGSDEIHSKKGCS